MKPRIGIFTTSNEALTKTKTMTLQRSSSIVVDAVRSAIIKAGGTPIAILPNQDIDYYNTESTKIPKLLDEEKEELISNLVICDGLIIPGGVRFFEHDLFMCRYALNQNMPLLGICRGMQIMAATDNIKYDDYYGTVQKIETDLIHFNTIHNVRVLENSKLAHIMKGNHFKVNSLHNMGVTKVHDATISAYGEDGTIEAIEFRDNDYAIGVQWHPETLMENLEESNIISSLIEASKKR